MNTYDEAARRELRAAVMNANVEPARAEQVVDLACHAAERAAEAFTAIIRTAPDSAIGLMAFELGAQLAAARMSGMFDRVHALGRDQGGPYAATSVQVPR